MTIDYRGRLAAILGEVGGNTSEVARRFGISRRSQRRILQGAETRGGDAFEDRKITGTIKTKISTAYRRVISDDNRAAERRYGKAQPDLMTYEQAKAYSKRLRRLGIDHKIGAQQDVRFQRTTPAGLGRVEEDTMYMKGDDVDQVRQNLEDRLARREAGTDDSAAIRVITRPEYDEEGNEIGQVPVNEIKYRVILTSGDSI